MLDKIDNNELAGSLWQDKSNPNRFWLLLELSSERTIGEPIGPYISYRGFVTDDGETFSIGTITSQMDSFYNRIF